MYPPLCSDTNQVPGVTPIHDMDHQVPFPIESSENDPSPHTKNGIIYQYHYHYPLMTPSVITMIKDKDFSLPKWDLKEMKWSEFYLKVVMAVHKYKMESLLVVSAMVVENCTLSSKLCYELYKKLHGSALALLNLIDAWSYYLQRGRGIEMMQALKYKFNSLSFEHICALQDKLQKLALAPHQDLDDFVNELHDINMMLN